MRKEGRFRLVIRLALTLVAVGLLAALGLVAWSGRSAPRGIESRAPQLLYLGRPTPGADVRQLFLSALDGSAPRQISDQPLGVWAYAVHPQGQAIVYSALRDDGGADLWRVERDSSKAKRLLACPGAACLDPAWSPDGRQLAYERRAIGREGPDLGPQAARIWLLDLKSGQARPLFDYDVPLHSPEWAPKGRRLAYVSPLLPGVEVYDLDTGDLEQFGNEWAAAPVWSPDAAHLALPQLLLAGEQLIVHLLRLDLESGQAVDLSGQDGADLLPVKDVSPAWSPAGDWIALGRQFVGAEGGTPGRQLWLTRPDGAETHALLSEAMADYYGFAWSPDGAALAYVRNDLSAGLQPVPDVSVWVLDLSEQQPQLIAADGVSPKWLP